MRRAALFFLLMVFAFPVSACASAKKATIDDVLDLLSEGADSAAFERVDAHWQPSFVPMILETMHLSRDPGLTRALIGLLEKHTGRKFGYDVNAWYEWLWNREENKHPHYARFKGELYKRIDPKFGAYFADSHPVTIRLDEVRWGGVLQDGIPPLRDPEMIPAAQADYLKDDHVVFGLTVNGDARAYPKRILAWHEMFVDTVGGLPVAGVYCTLCGSMILYQTTLDGTNHRLGTSGFLYRSNKLMYDKATQSLWNTFWGKPVIGPLVGKGIELKYRGVVTSTWGEWKKRHPDSKVLSLNTGHFRDYSEGAAYRRYFATDELMFNVPKLDKRLKNKAEILALLFPQHPDKPLAIAAAHLLDNPVYQNALGTVNYVVLTDASGANRVYNAGGVTFQSWDREFTATDAKGRRWQVTEDALISKDGKQKLPRLPAYRAFWFGWFSAYPHSQLIKG